MVKEEEFPLCFLVISDGDFLDLMIRQLILIAKILYVQQNLDPEKSVITVVFYYPIKKIKP